MKKYLLAALCLLGASLAYADTKISAMTSTTTLNDSDVLPIVSGSNNYKITAKNAFVKNQETLQNGTSFYVSSGSIDTGGFSLRGRLDINRSDLNGFSGANRIYFDPSGQNPFILQSNQTIAGTPSIQFRGYSNSSGATISAIPEQTYASFIIAVSSAFSSTSSPSNRIAIGGFYDGRMVFNNNLGSEVMRINSSSVSISGATGLNISNLTTSQFVKSDGSNNLISYDLFNDSPTYAGQGLWTSAQASTFTALAVTGLSGSTNVCTDSNKKLTTSGCNNGTITQAYATVDNAGSALTQRATINFTGTGITCVDNSGSTRTDCTVTAGGSGGASTLATALASTTSWTTQVSSPSAAVAFDQSQFTGQLTGSATGFFSIAYSTNSQTSNYTFRSTDSVVIANCGSACTITLPDAALFPGKVFWIKIIGTGTTTISTTSSQTIDGSTSIVPTPNQWTDIQVISDKSNWEIL